MKKKIIDTSDIKWVVNSHKVMFKNFFKIGTFVLSIIKIPPNTKLSKHFHPENEYIFITEGFLYDEDGKYGKGTFFINPKGSIHSPYTGKTECSLIALWCGRVEDIND